MPTIDNISPGFRDALLNRNIISDTVEDNGLFSLLAGIGLPVSIETLPIAVSASNDIEEEGKEFQETTLLLNKYKGTSDDYRKVDLYYLPSTYESFTSYLTKNGKLNFGGPATQISDIVSDIPILSGFDIRSSLAGRVLTSTGLESDSPIGVLGAKYLGESILANLAFNTLEETIGNINTNPLSLANGGDIILPSYKLTVPKGESNSPIDILERITGAKVPVSLLDESSSIFTFNEKSNTNSSFIDRADSMIQNTGKGQILALFANISTNTNPNLIGKRNGYSPGYTDKRISEGENTEGGTNENVYAFENRLKENISNPDSYPISKSNTNNRTKEIEESGFPGLENLSKSYNNNFARDGSTNDYGTTQFIWSDDNRNYLGTRENGLYNGTEFNNSPKSILLKTQELFNSGKMRVLTTGKSIQQNEEQINSSVSNTAGLSFMSKGSAVRSYLEDGVINEDPDHMFCRTWSTVDRYNQIYDLQKHSGINPKGRKNKIQDITESVLEDTGMVRIAPYITDEQADIKRFMFSIENLAWDGNDYYTKLLKCEKGPGDLLTGKKGRIMWFPPYNISFNESVSVNWDKKDFIGRGEPIYTYNNTERTGSLSWQIVVDHPNYMNYFPKEWGNDEISSFFAGCLEMQDIRDQVLTKEEQAQLDVKTNTEVKESEDKTDIEPLTINFFFPNDISEFPYEIGGKKYEDGLTSLTGSDPSPLNPQLGRINYNDNSDGKGDGLGFTFDEGVVSTNQEQTKDDTNFGLNGWKNVNIESINNILTTPPEKYIESLYDPELITRLSKYFENECKYCKINIVGLASTHINEGKNTKTNASKNEELSKKRANSIKKFFKDNILKNDSLGDKRFSVKGNGTDIGGDCKSTDGQETIGCKKQRRTEVTISYDANLATQDNEDTNVDPSVNEQILRAPVSRFFSECNYFRKMEQDDKFAYDRIKEKIQYFQPAFHSITPEGFNSRLTFLHQCTRQGSTANNDNNPDNLSFGRPPICILRIGDFYHTKIAIDSLTIDYDPLVWDLNPEGIGVQPMIANVTISFAFIGGSSLKGPINRLQNAISSNFYANTEIYDPRAEKIKIKTETNSEGKEVQTAEIEPGSFPTDKGIDTTNQSNTNLTVAQQEDEAEKELAKQAEDERNAKEAAEKAKENDLILLRGISIDGYSSPGSISSNELGISITFNINPEEKTNFSLTKEYTGKLYVINNSTNETFEVGTLKAQPNVDDTSFVLNSVIDQKIVDKSSKKELKFNVFDITNLTTQLKSSKTLIKNKLIPEYKTLKLEWVVPGTKITSNIPYSETIAEG